MKRVLYVLLGVIIFIFLLLGMFYHMLVVSPDDYEKKQDNYFSKVEYDFTGTVTKYQYLGGVYALIYLKPSSFQIKKNMLNQNDDFAGLYSKKDNVIILFANFDLLMNDKYNSLEKNKMEIINIEIKVNSLERKIYYSNGNSQVGETYLCPASVYARKLINAEKTMNESIRF